MSLFEEMNRKKRKKVNNLSLSLVSMSRTVYDEEILPSLVLTIILGTVDYANVE